MISYATCSGRYLDSSLIINKQKITPELYFAIKRVLTKGNVKSGWKKCGPWQREVITRCPELLQNKESATKLLGLYRQLLQLKEIPFNNSPEMQELLLSGLVSIHKGKIKIFNRIYEAVFDANWVEKHFKLKRR